MKKFIDLFYLKFQLIELYSLIWLNRGMRIQLGKRRDKI